MSDDVLASFLLDENVDRAVGTFLRADGYPVTHVVDVISPGADDVEDILPYAVDNDLVIVTKDTDFLTVDPTDHAGVCFIDDHRIAAYDVANAIVRILEAVPDRDHLRGVVYVDSWR